MVDKIEKALSKLTEKERKVVKNVLLKVQEGSIDSLDIKKLKGRSDIFRARKGKIRIIFRKTKDEREIKWYSLGRIIPGKYVYQE